jgi:hypothetical protein
MFPSCLDMVLLAAVPKCRPIPMHFEVVPANRVTQS